MVYDFVITLKKRNDKFTDQVSMLMYAFTLITFSYFAYTATTPVVYILFCVAILIALIIAIKRKQKKGTAFFRLGLLIAGIAWLYVPERNVWMGILYILAGMLEKQVKFPAEIGFAKDEVVLNSFPKKRMKWNELNNVVLKDGLLTIDQKNNKVFQKEIDEAVSPAIEIEFNAFCKACLDGKTLVESI